MSSNAFDPIPNEINAIGTHIVDAAVKVHKAMGAGLLESVYEECMAYELGRRNLSVEKINPIFESQLMTYLRLSGLRLGYLINFNVPLVKNGIKRMVM